MRKLGIDLGEVRVGLAISDPSATLARPFGVLPRRDLDGEAERLSAVIRDQGVDEVIVGLPRSMSGHEGPMAVAVRSVVAHLAEVLAVPVHTLDERLTSVEAKRAMAWRGRGRHRDPGGVDEVAAAIILQNYLDSLRAAARRGGRPAHA
jgi:putative Holliday junction resolvase